MQERAEAPFQALFHRGPTNMPFTTSLAGSATSTASRAGSTPQLRALRGLTQPPATPPPPSPQFPPRRSATAPTAASDTRPPPSSAALGGYGLRCTHIHTHPLGRTYSTAPARRRTTVGGDK